MKQATVIWILALALMGFLAYDWYLLWDTQQIGSNPVMRVGLAIVTVVVSFAVISVFPFLARFQVSTKAAIRNAVWFGILHIPQMILIILLYAMTIYICIRYMEWLILAWAVGTGLTLYYSSRMFVKQFAKLEPKKEEPKKITSKDREEIAKEQTNIENIISKSEETEIKKYVQIKVCIRIDIIFITIFSI